jgi:hypothetical protein
MAVHEAVLTMSNSGCGGAGGSYSCESTHAGELGKEESPDGDDGAVDCSAYLKAVETFPSLEAMFEEVDPVLFLRRENFSSARDAAVPLALHWSQRLKLFGPERFCRPYERLDGTGAMTSEDVKFLRDILRSAVYRVYPNDAKGRHVAILDRTRITPGGEGQDGHDARMSVFKTLFYLIHVAGTQPVAFVRFSDCSENPKLDPQKLRKGFELAKCMPAKWDAIYDVYKATPGAYFTIIRVTANFCCVCVPGLVVVYQVGRTRTRIVSQRSLFPPSLSLPAQGRSGCSKRRLRRCLKNTCLSSGT